MSSRFQIGLIGVCIAVFVALALLIVSVYKIPPGYNGVVYSMSGGIQDEVKGQGWGIMWPHQKVIKYPVSTEMNEITIEGNTGDGKTVELKIQYAYHMNPEMLPHIFTKFRGRSAEEIANTYINQQIRDHVQAETRKHSVLGVYSQNTTQIIENIKERLTDTLAVDGIVLERFTISDVIPDEETLTTLQAIADAENRNELLKREERNKQQEAKNNLIEAEGKKAVQIVEAEAQAERQLIEAQAQAEANRLLTQSLSEQVIRYEWIKKWSGELPTHMLSENTDILLGK